MGAVFGVRFLVLSVFGLRGALKTTPLNCNTKNAFYFSGCFKAARKKRRPLNVRSIFCVRFNAPLIKLASLYSNSLTNKSYSTTGLTDLDLFLAIGCSWLISSLVARSNHCVLVRHLGLSIINDMTNLDIF